MTTVVEALAWGTEQLSTANAAGSMRSHSSQADATNVVSAPHLGEMWDPLRDARTLLQFTLKRNHAWIVAHGSDAIDDAAHQRFEAFIRRRGTSEPLQYITGEQEFYGIPLRVTHDVLIPRPETEHLVEEALLLLEAMKPGARLLDVGTGSGAIVVPIALASPQTRITAVDLSAAALNVAQSNLAAHNLLNRVRLVESDLLSAVEGSEFEMIVSNPPYVADSEHLADEVRNYEPHTALFAGEDGLAIYRRLIPQAVKALTPGGWLLLEMGAGQSEALRTLLEAAALANIRFADDLQRIPRIAIAQKTAQ